jgi:hypothetical protein
MNGRLEVVGGADVTPRAPVDAELADLYAARLAFVNTRIADYGRRRALAQAGSSSLRSLGWALLTLGALLPALREAAPAFAEAALSSLAFGYVFLGLGAGALMIDRGLKLGPAAARYSVAELALEGERELFEADWRIAGERSAPDARRRRLDLARSFTAEVNRIVRRESERAAEQASVEV